MADTTYRVVLNLSTEGNLGASLGSMAGSAGIAHGSLARLRETAKSMGEAVGSIGEKIGGALESAADKAIELGKHLAMAGAAAGIGLAVYGVAHLNQELENTQISLAAIFSARGLAGDFAGGMTMAADQVTKMKQDVKSLPGDLGQLSGVMKMIANPAAHAGANADDIRKLAGRTMLAAGIFGENLPVAQMQMAELLQGRANKRNNLAQQLGIAEDSHAFNASSAAERLARINKELDKFSGAASRFGQSFTAQWTTLVDNLKYGLIANTTAPLFERVKHTLAEINTWFDNNQDKVQYFANVVGTKLANAWDAVVEAAKRLEPIVGRIVGMFEDLRPGGGSLVATLEKGAGIAIGGKLLGMGISGGSKLAGNGISALMGGGEAAAAAGSSALFLAPLLMTMATGAVAAAGAFHAFNDESSIFHDQVVALWGDITTKLGPAVERLGTELEPVGELFVRLADSGGTTLLYVIDKSIDGLNRMMNAMDALGMMARNWWNMAFGNGAKLGDDIPGPAIKDHSDAAMDALMASHAFPRALAEAEAKVQRGAGGGGGGTHVENVFIEVKGNTDPSRVAKLTVLEIQKLARNPKSSRYVANYSGDRG